jgi:hypothetical protein
VRIKSQRSLVGLLHLRQVEAAGEFSAPQAMREAMANLEVRPKKTLHVGRGVDTDSWRPAGAFDFAGQPW